MPDHDIVIAAGRELWAIRHDVLEQWLTARLVLSSSTLNVTSFHSQPIESNGIALSKASKLPSVQGNVAIIPVHGPISQRSSIWHEIFGGASTQGIQAAYSRAVNDERVGAVVFDVDSPGGTVAGVQEAAAFINQGASIKPTYAVANSEMASAAYWMASQVGKGHLIAAPGADVGSIGVFAMHEDVSELLAKRGIKVSMLAIPEHKAEFNPYQPLGADSKEHFMGQIADTYEQFVSDVARGRSAKNDKVKADYGKGRTFHATMALDKGMVDRIETLPNVVSELLRNNASARVTVSSAAECERGIIQAFQSGKIECFKRQPSVDIRRRTLLTKTV